MGNRIDNLHKKAGEIVEKKETLSESSELLSSDLEEIRGLLDAPLQDEDDVAAEGYLERTVSSDLSSVESELQENDSERADALDETDSYISSLEENLQKLDEMKSVSDLGSESISSDHTERQIEELQFIRELLDGDDNSSFTGISNELSGSSSSFQERRIGFLEDLKPETITPDNADPILTEINKASTNKAQLANMAIKYHLSKDADFGNLDTEVAREMVRTIYLTKKEFKDLELQFIGSLQERNNRLEIKLSEFYMEEYKKANPDMTEEELLPYVQNNVEWDMRAARKYLYQPNTIAQSSSVKKQDRLFDKATNAVGGIVINEDYGSDYNYLSATKKNEVYIKHKPIGCDTIKASVDHELGHQIDHMLDVNQDKIIIDSYNDFMLMTPARQGDELSTYASTNIREFIAECWSEYRNNPNCREIAKKIGIRIEEIRKANNHGSIGQKTRDRINGFTK